MKRHILLIFITTLLLIACQNKRIPPKQHCSAKQEVISEYIAIPILQVKPEYPARALIKEITGCTTFLFDITHDGTPTNIRVIDSKPEGVFDKEAFRAISRWKFRPRIVNGQAIIQKNLIYTLEFTLDY